MCLQNIPEVESEGGPKARVNSAVEIGLEEPAAGALGDMHTKLMSLQSTLGLPSNRTSIVL